MDHCYSENILRRPNGTYYRKEKNKEWNSMRCKVEPVFGFITNSMKGGLLRAIGLSRAKIKIGLTNLTYNFCRLEQLKRTGRIYLYELRELGMA